MDIEWANGDKHDKASGAERDKHMDVQRENYLHVDGYVLVIIYRKLHCTP